MNVRLWLLTALALTASYELGVAGPYELRGVYTNSKDRTKSIEVPITNGAILPTRTEDGELDKIVVHFDKKGLGAITTGTFRNFALALFTRALNEKAPSEPTLTLSVASADIAKGPAARTLVDLTKEPALAPSTTYRVNIRGKFSPEFLCAQELALRQAIGKPRSSACPKPPSGTGSATGAKAPSGSTAIACGTSDLYGNAELQPDRPLFSEGHEILFTFCRSTAAPKTDPVQWAVVHKDGRFGKAASDRAIAESHKLALHKLLLDSGTLSRFMSTETPPQSGPDTNDHPANLFVEEELTFQVEALNAAIVLRRNQKTTVSNVVDQEDTLSVRTAPDGSSDRFCVDPRHYKYVLENANEGQDTTSDTLSYQSESSCELRLEVDLKKYVEKRVTLKIIREVDAQHQLVVFRKDFQVADLGFYWSAPAFSEITAALKAKSPSDLSATSSIPLGIAVGRDGRTRYSLSFAFKAWWNPESFPRFSRYFSGYGHATVLADPDNDFKTELAIGVGANVFQFFYFGWGISMEPTHYNYFLLSVDINDISKFVLAELGD